MTSSAQLKQERKQKLILESKSLSKSILILALPIFLSNFMKAFNDIIDLYFVTNLIDESIVEYATTAINIPGPVINITHALAGGFMTAGAAIIAQYLGAKKKQEANKVAGQLLSLCIITGIVMNIFLYIFTPTIMRWMGAEGLSLEFMIQYIRIRSFEMVPLFAFFAFQASRTASGDTVTPFVLNIIMIVFNIASTWLFISYFQMGVRGAALGTMLANLIIMPIFIILMFKGGERHVSIKISDVKIDPIEIRRIFKLAWPVSIAQAFTSLGFLILNSIIYSYGNATVNAFGTGNRINSMVLMPAMGIGSITATFVGQNIGAENVKRARQSVRSAMRLSIIIAIVGAAIILPIRRELISLFLGKQEEAMNLSVEYMFFILTGLPLMSIFQVFMGTYQGSGETKFSLIMSMLRLWVMRIPMVLLFKNVFHLPSSTIWYAMIISNFGSAYIGTILYSKCKFLPQTKIRKQKSEEACLT